MHKIAMHHFKKVDPKLHAVAEEVFKKHGEIKLCVSGDLFSDLCEAIVGQQLSGKAAATIFGRFRELFRAGRITPKRVLELPSEEMRACGMSSSKVSFVKDLAQRVLKGELELSLDAFEGVDEAEIVGLLTQVKGIGPWTAEMFLMFSLAREDVFSHGDLGLRKAIKKLYFSGGSAGKKSGRRGDPFEEYEPTAAEIEKIAVKWSPFKTYASMILWKSLEL
ncbi:MAG: hypothetical protein AAB443_04270 [Patescibacteria group bacterium]